MYSSQPVEPGSYSQIDNETCDTRATVTKTRLSVGDTRRNTSRGLNSRGGEEEGTNRSQQHNLTPTFVEADGKDCLRPI